MTIAPVAPATPSDSSPVKPDLGQLRTIMAADRTLMAWTRTSLALLSFSFTIYKVLEGLERPGKVLHPHAPEAAGLFLAAMGILSMIMGSIQYALTVRELQKHGPFPRFFRIPAVMAGLQVVIGLGLIVGIAARRI
jgi:putative membrane protein